MGKGKRISKSKRLGSPADTVGEKDSSAERSEITDAGGSTRSNIRYALYLAGVLGALGVLQKFNTDDKPQPLIVDGVSFTIGPAINEKINNGKLDREKLERLLDEYFDKLREYMDVPEGMAVELDFKEERGGHIELSMAYDMEKMKERVLEITDVDISNKMRISPDLLAKSSMLHELAHLVRVNPGCFVLHHGFEEGLAEYVEQDAYPNKKANPEKGKHGPHIFQFLDHFPELEKVALEDPVFGFREIYGRAESNLIGVAAFKHEIRRRAWARFLDDKNHPERKGFLRKLQKAQIAAKKEIWRVDDVLKVGDGIDAEFSTWFSGEKVFQVAEERKVARAILRGKKLSMLLFEQRKIAKKNPADPDIYEMVPFRDKMQVYVNLVFGPEMKADFDPVPLGIIQHLDLAVLFRRLGSADAQIGDINVGFRNGEKIPLKILGD